MIASRPLGAGRAYVEQWGPEGFAELVVNCGGVCRAVALRRVPTTPETAQALLDAMPESALLDLHTASVGEAAADAKACLDAVLGRRAMPVPAEMPSWGSP
jgi:hypothetical protein